jgi:hypothetical protein
LKYPISNTYLKIIKGGFYLKNIIWVKLLLLSIAFMFIACSAEHGKTPQPTMDPVTMDPVIKKMMEEPKLVHKDDQFEMKLNIQKTKFKVGEPIHYSASLTYIGNNDSITLWGPQTYIVFTLTDGKKTKMEGATTAELKSTRLIRGETHEYPFFKSGVYSDTDPDAKFWKNFYAESDLLLPAGTYLIAANCEFSLTEKVVDSHYDGEVHTTIIVE